MSDSLQESTHETDVELGMVLAMSSKDTLVLKRRNKSASTEIRADNTKTCTYEECIMFK